MIQKKMKLPYWIEMMLRYILTIWYYLHDIAHLISFRTRKMQKRQNLERSITEEYHAIEKGLTKSPFREGFGVMGLNRLFSLLDLYISTGNSTSNVRYSTAISVINAYIERHSNSSANIDYVKKFIANHTEYDRSVKGGVKRIPKSQIMYNSGGSFENLVHSRVSVRDFGEERISNSDIEKAIDLAQNSPSVCNRQGWHVRVIENTELISKVLNLQGGYKGHGKNISFLLLVTGLNNFFRYPSERHQMYTDGGLFSMSLMYALTYYGIASCPLNSNLSIKKAKKVRSLLKIRMDESFIMFISAGSFPNEVVTTRSYRDSISDKVLYI